MDVIEKHKSRILISRLEKIHICIRYKKFRKRNMTSNKPKHIITAV